MESKLFTELKLRFSKLVLLFVPFAAALAIAACAERTETATIVIPTATPAAVETPVAAPGQSTAPTATPTATRTAAPTPGPTSTPAPTATPTATPTPTPTPTPAPSIASAKSAALLVATLGVPAAEVSYDVIKRVDWPDTALGCQEPGRSYAEVIVPGWTVVVRHGSKLYEYHTDLDGDRVVTCDPKFSRSVGAINPASALGLKGVTRVEVAAITAAGTPVSAVSIVDPAVVSQVIASLNLELPLYEPKQCTPPLIVSFVMPDRTESVLYACPGDGTVLRGVAAFSGREVRAPEAFQKLINKALGDRPFPTMPNGQQG
ncbi:MAG: hypothetical protein HY678_09520 [Chloroflexi bacterium]|nr:hypothetical protein [Chloroflexota bacterium]